MVNLYFQDQKAFKEKLAREKTKDQSQIKTTESPKPEREKEQVSL